MKRSFRIVRFFFSIILIIVLVRRFDFGSLMTIVADMRWEFLLSGIVTFFLHDLIKAYKWRILLAIKGAYIPLSKLLRLDYASRFLSLFVPSSISIDLFRVYGLSRHAYSLNRSASSVIVDRFLNLFALVMITDLSLLIFHDIIKVPGIALVGYALLFFMVVCLVALFTMKFETVIEMIGRIAFGKAMFSRLSLLLTSILDYKRSPQVMIYVFILSLVTQFLRVLIYFFSALAVNSEISFMYLIMFTPVVVLISMLPFSIAGIGIRESSFVFFYSKVGVPTASAFAVSALVSMMVLASAFPGGIIIAFKGLVLKKESGDGGPIVRRKS